MAHGKTKRFFTPLGVALFLGMVILIWRVCRLDPAFSDPALVGLTPQQVIQQFGPPTFDPRVAEGWTDEAKDGPLYLGYFGPVGQTYVFTFENGKVVGTHSGRK